ncbi:MAG TPA: flagellar hook capping FlgD N-terminal domain-containing protein [Fimbriimonadaceae bacterium]|jgi:flagellar basal-body rod modification protein FlgD
MAVSSILNSSANGAATANSGSNTALNMTEFLQLLTTQLADQDPLNPTSDSDFFAQLAQMGTVQGVDQMQQSMQVTQASSLMGQTVTGLTTNSAGEAVPVTGTVTSLSISNGSYLLNVTDSSGYTSQVNMSSLQSVSGQTTTKTSTGS